MDFLDSDASVYQISKYSHRDWDGQEQYLTSVVLLGKISAQHKIKLHWNNSRGLRGRYIFRSSCHRSYTIIERTAEISLNHGGMKRDDDHNFH